MNDATWWDDVCRSNPWMIWSPEHDLWFVGFGADLAAKYLTQGCAVRLMPESQDEHLERPYGRWPEAEPDAPPYTPRQIVWYERAARYMPDFYGATWRRIEEYLTSVHRDTPDQVVSRWRAELGEWGGGYNLKAARYGQPKQQPLFSEAMF